MGTWSVGGASKVLSYKSGSQQQSVLVQKVKQEEETQKWLHNRFVAFMLLRVMVDHLDDKNKCGNIKTLLITAGLSLY